MPNAMKQFICIISILLYPHTNLWSAFFNSSGGSWLLGKRLRTYPW